MTATSRRDALRVIGLGAVGRGLPASHAHARTAGGRERDAVAIQAIETRRLGYHDAVARIVASHPVDAIQINYSVGEREAEQRLLPLARERGIAVIANRPFAGGQLFDRLRATPLPAWAAEIDCSSWAQILLEFVVSPPRGDVRDSRDLQGGPPARQHAGRPWPHARCRLAAAHRRRGRIA